MEVSLQFVIALSSLIVVALVLPWTVRWLTNKRNAVLRRGQTFAIRDVFALEPKKRLCVFDYENTRYLVILGPDSDTLVDVRPLTPPSLPHDEPDHDQVYYDKIHSNKVHTWGDPRL